MQMAFIFSHLFFRVSPLMVRHLMVFIDPRHQLSMSVCLYVCMCLCVCSERDFYMTEC